MKENKGKKEPQNFIIEMFVMIYAMFYGWYQKLIQTLFAVEGKPNGLFAGGAPNKRQ